VARRGGAARGGDLADRLPGPSGEFVQLVVDYAKQETLEPLQGLGRFVGYGLAGALALSVGLIIVLIGVLRLLQTETGSTFTGNLSWIPYLITGALALIIIALAVWRITRGPAMPTAPDHSEGKAA
jgi:Putative Actinobacterial Holin-X, holin superfamily III